MVKIDRIYTKKGDKGETSLVGGRRLSKDDTRVEAYGTVDELNSVVGVIRSFALAETDMRQWEQFCRILQAIQQKLFDVGSELATHGDDSYEGQIKASEEDVLWLEKIIDQINKQLQPLESFVLPGGDVINAHLHQARTICRRAERQVIRLHKQASINAKILAFLNRLSDLMFVLARWVCITKKIPETLWQPKNRLPEWID